MTHAIEDHGKQAESGNELAERLRHARTNVLGGAEQGVLEHDVSGGDAGERPKQLGHQVAWNASPGHGSTSRFGERHGGVEVRPGNRPEREDERDQRSPGGERVGEQPTQRCPVRVIPP
jgi:hypothetical protein